MTVRCFGAVTEPFATGSSTPTTGNGTVVTSFVVFVQRELNADNVDMVIIVLVGSMSACSGLRPDADCQAAALEGAVPTFMALKAGRWCGLSGWRWVSRISGRCSRSW